MNVLLDQVPVSVPINGTQVKIQSDFRIGLRFELLMTLKLSQREKVHQALKLYYQQIPSPLEQAVEQMLWFFQCGERINNQKQSGRNKQIYSYEYDQYLIYTAFLFYYHIDLNEIAYLHWWKFRKLFLELPDDSQMKKVMMYRSVSLNSNMTKEQRQYYARMKRLYALPDERSEQMKANEYAGILAKGMRLEKDEVEL
ncbi:MAG: hypothetical protein HFE68_03650 [Erysipelotrichaceae bacterium]|nr:hypothetical protein [Erysipelotrichaceae bacterium]